MIKDWSKATTYLSVGAIGAGFVMIFLAWNNAAGVDYTQGQIPYLISGGVGGLGLLLVGTALMILQNSRRDRAALVRELEKLEAALDRAAKSISVSGNGATAAGTFIAGASSFHRPECRLAQGREDADRVSRDEATERGLNACRICKP